MSTDKLHQIFSVIEHTENLIAELPALFEEEAKLERAMFKPVIPLLQASLQEAKYELRDYLEENKH
ncbi:MAG: hypothetical protein KZQ77_06850 [Candidatus Thiodiazotropha sp. (ex Notomyrtea botanica)]|nr:hypothetical protein [Candidatus Thiodiazotropha sp. (ex Notomyrtea botanica)]